jgi:succinoglycan biosynthesis transport protein ExoP
MDFKAFFKHVNRFKWLLIIVPLLTITITYFMVKNLPKQYSSEAQISTGLVDQSKQVSTDQNMDYFRLSQQFGNIMDKLKMKKIMSILSYHLIIHDLENPKNSFKPYSQKLDSLTETQRIELASYYKDKLVKKAVLAPTDKGGNFNLSAYVASMYYDEKSILKGLTVSRPDGSDNIYVSYIAESPYLSEFVVNTLTTEFVENYAKDVNFNQNNSIALLDSLLKKKEAVMNQKNSALKSFKMANGVLNLDKQSEIVYSQISANEERKSQAIRDIQANQGAISAIESKLRGADPYTSGGNVVAQNREMVDLKNQLKVANDRYIDGNFKAADKRKMDSLTSIINNRTARNSDNNIVDPTASKQNLIAQRANLSVTMDQAKSSIASIDRELAQLKAKYNTMVPFDAGIQNYERDADLATKDYMDALNRYNQTRTEQNIGLRLNIAQVGYLGAPEPSKAILYLASSALGSFAICFMAVVGLFFLDNTIHSSKQLALATGLPVIGSLNYVNVNGSSIKSIWNDAETPNYLAYKNLLRSIRLEITNQMEADGSQILGITSLNSGEGKSFVASSLAHAFSMTGKKILLIGGEKPVIDTVNTKALAITENFETFLIKREIHTQELVTVLNKNQTNTSLLEIQSSKNLKAGFEMLRKEFDIIIVDVNSLRDINVAKEWLLFTEKNVAVFEAGRALSDNDRELLANLKGQASFIGWILNKVKISGKIKS